MYRSDYKISPEKKEILKNVFNHITHNYMIKITESIKLTRAPYRLELEFDDSTYGKGTKFYDSCKERLMKIGLSKIESITILDSIISKIQRQCMKDADVTVKIDPTFNLDLSDIEILTDEYARRFNGGCYENIRSSTR